jgi:hypothetical protein
VGGGARNEARRDARGTRRKVRRLEAPSAGIRWLGIYVLVFAVLGAVLPAPDRCDSSDNWFYVLAAVGLLGAMAGGYAISVSRHGNRSSRPYFQASFNLLAGAAVLVLIGFLRAGAAGCFE